MTYTRIQPRGIADTADVSIARSAVRELRHDGLAQMAECVDACTTSAGLLPDTLDKLLTLVTVCNEANPDPLKMFTAIEQAKAVLERADNLS